MNLHLDDMVTCPPNADWESARVNYPRGITEYGDPL